VNLKQPEALTHVTRCGTFKRAAESLGSDSPGGEFLKIPDPMCETWLKDRSCDEMIKAPAFTMEKREE